MNQCASVTASTLAVESARHAQPAVSFRTAVHRSIASVCLWIAAIHSSSAVAQTPALLLFGDADHKTFLGCLNCSQFDSGSVCNEFGKNGSEFNSYSIWNEFGTFGSEFSSYSPWNQFSTKGPVIVDRNGKFYGRLTANQFAGDRTRIRQLNQLTDLVAGGMKLEAARKLFCGG